MFLFPVGCLLFLLFLFLLPLLFLLGFFHIITFGFSQLGLSPEITILILLSVLLGSVINIPLTRKKIVYAKRYFFFLSRRSQPQIEGLAINLGGAIIPLALSGYFLTKVPWQPTMAVVLLMVIIAKLLARTVPGRGIVIPAFVPPLFSALFALILAPEFAAPVAFIAGVGGTLIGADLLNLRKARKLSKGFISIGGAGVFDGIFLVGIVSAILAGL